MKKRQSRKSKKPETKRTYDVCTMHPKFGKVVVLTCPDKTDAVNFSAQLMTDPLLAHLAVKTVILNNILRDLHLEFLQTRETQQNILNRLTILFAKIVEQHFKLAKTIAKTQKRSKRS